jgi:hypothetical protein
MRRLRILLAAVAIFAFVNGRLCAQTVTFSEDGFILPGDYYTNVWIYDTPPDMTTVEMSGGDVLDMDIYMNSTLNMSDGAIDLLWASDFSTVNVSGGGIWDAHLEMQSMLELGAGTIETLQALDGSKVTVSGGTIQNVDLRGQSTINISDGYVRGLEGREEVTFNITGGDVGDELLMYDYSTANISAGNYMHVGGQGHSSINLSGGQFMDVDVWEEASLDISGGTFEHVLAGGWGPAAQISGGAIQHLLLENNLLDISWGEIYSLENMNAQATINISNGYVRGLEGREEVTFNITGGDVDPILQMYDYSTANISAGDYMGIDGHEHSTINLSGGQFANVGVWEEASLSISGGTFEHVWAGGWGPAAQVSGGSIQSLSLENSVLDISGGEIYSLENMNAQAIINISDGYVRGLEGQEQVTFNITGGDVGDELLMYDYSTANISAGNYIHVGGQGHSSINLSGGQFMDVDVWEEACLNISGGTFEHVMANGWGPAAQISGGAIQHLLLENNLLDISGGEIYSLENMNAQATINISDGYVRGLEGREEVTFNISGGDVDPILRMDDYSTLNISAGINQMIGGLGHSSIDVSGGQFDLVVVLQEASLNISGGQFTDVGAEQNSKLGISGGTFEHVLVWENVMAEIFGGTIQEFLASDSSTTDIFGGEIVGFLCADGSSVVNIYGYGFAYDPYGGGQNGGQLTGFWLDNTGFVIDFMDCSPTSSTYYDHVYLVPEPTTLLLLGLGGLMLRRRRCVV